MRRQAAVRFFFSSRAPSAGDPHAYLVWMQRSSRFEFVNSLPVSMSLRLGTGSRGGKMADIAISRWAFNIASLVEVVTLLGSNNRGGVGQRDDARHGRGSQAEAVDQDGLAR